MTVRSMVVERFGQPLVPADRPEPVPGPGEVVIRVLVCGLCRTDLKIVDGRMPFSARQVLPHVPGHEVVGEVAARGPGTALPVGQRVVVFNYWGCGRCPHCLAGEENLCDALRGWVGFTTPGGLQEYLTVPEGYLLPLPPNVTDPQGAAMSCALGTGYRAVVTRGAVRAGETVVVIGTGGVGLHALQFARAAGARTVAVDVGQAQLAAARQVGADLAVRPEEASGVSREVTGGRGADLVVDCVGSGASTALAVGLVRKGGRMVLVGYTTDEAHQPTIPTDQIVLREVSIIGSRYLTRPELARAIDLVGRGLVRPVISEVLELAEVNTALQRIREGRAAGRVVVRVAGAA
ncbi:MAG: alcohol dehydrogenase catalytic domain-containing protein [Armatimonadota bacterium]|nr:alcohol dehydrogenase catalytic domain-containing protein [Armatimonadota bacterium]MDR7498266.1 alcohol dehydrogenase catalytic domain-containing protein [Armatimonadota bacterium]MDR7557717.1 alcohol dehydrogenase catalytic domain-containing protein [Armatimonadota bacterium]